MGLSVSFASAATYAIGLALLFLFGSLLLKPLKWILKLVCNALVGGLLLILVNVLGGALGFVVTINPLTSLIAGVLGIPGVVLLVFASLLF